MSDIKLEWMERIRKRLEDNHLDMTNLKYKDDEFILYFLKPIMEYGESEEKRIKEELTR